MYVWINVQIAEVLQTGIFDADLADGDSQFLHQVQGIVIGTSGSTESRHGDTDDVFARQSEQVEGLHADQKG